MSRLSRIGLPLFIVSSMAGKRSRFCACRASLMEGHDVLRGDIAAIAALGALALIVVAFVLQKYQVRGLSFGTVR